MRCSKQLRALSVLTLAISSPIVVAACQQTTGPGDNVAPSVSAPGSADAAKKAPAGEQLTAYTPSSSYTPLSSCNLSNFNGATFGAEPVTLEWGTPNIFSGWIITSGIAHPALWLRFDDRIAGRYLHMPFQLTINRPDVVAAHPDAAKVTGFDVTLPAAGLPGGRYHVYLAVKSGDVTYICDSGRHIEVKS